jgi:WD40 repeat protein
LVLPAALYHVAFNHDGRQVVTANVKHQAQVWEVETGQAVTQPLRHQDHRLNEFAIHYRCWPVFSPDGAAVVTVYPNKAREAAVNVWELAAARLRFPPIKQEYYFHQIRYNVSGSRLLTLNGDVAQVYEATTGRLVKALKHPRETQHGCFSPDGKVVATCSTGGLVHVWDLATGKELDEPLRCGNGVHTLAFSADSQLLLAASHDGTARVWRLTPPELGRPYARDCGHADRVTVKSSAEWVTFSPDGRREARFGGPKVRLRDRGGIEVELDHPQPVKLAHFSPDGKRLLTQDSKAVVRWWDATTGKPAARAVPLEAPLYNLSISADGQRLLTLEWGTARGIAGRVVTVWRVADGRPLFGPLQSWDSGPQRFENQALLHQITRAALSPDGTRLVLASDATGMVGVWDVDTGRELVRTRAYHGVLWGVQFSADGQRFLTFGSDTVARLWYTATAKPAGPPLRHPHFCRAADLGPDGWSVVTVDKTGITRLWAGRTGDLLGRIGQPLKKNQAWFSSDGRHLVLNGGEQLYALPACRGSATELPPLLRLLTGLQLEADGSIGPVDEQAFLSDPDGHRRAWQAWRGQADDPQAQPPLP